MLKAMKKAEIKKAEGRVSNAIAWVFIILQFCALTGYVFGLCSEGQKFSQIITRGFLLPWAFFVLFIRAEILALVGLIMELVGYNLLGIGALVLGLLVWLRWGNKKGRTTTLVAIVTIITSSILYFGGHDWWSS